MFDLQFGLTVWFAVGTAGFGQAWLFVLSLQFVVWTGLSKLELVDLLSLWLFLGKLQLCRFWASCSYAGLGLSFWLQVVFGQAAGL